MKKILASISIIGAVIAVVVGTTTSFFGDSESSVGNVLAAGAIDLGIDNSSYYNGVFSPTTSWELDYDLDDLETPRLFFNFTDLKPDDEGEDTISIHVDNNDAWACMEIDLTSKNDNGLTEPESDDGDATGGDGEGELQKAINFVWWADDGDNVLETDEVESIFEQADLDHLDGLKVVLADSSGEGLLSDGPLSGTETYYIGKAWCYGTLALNPVAEGLGVDPTIDSGIICEGTTLDNTTQTDSVTGNITFLAVQSRHNDGFRCAEEELPCTEENSWADGVESFAQGVQKGGGIIDANRSDPTDALGVAESSGALYDSPVLLGTFFSLGFNPDVSLGFGGNIVLTFPNFIINGPGDDLKAFEVTGGNPDTAAYPDERIKIEASKDGVIWTELAASVARDAEVDLGPLDWAKYVRVTDVSVRAEFSDTVADGYDLDGVKALNCATVEPESDE